MAKLSRLYIEYDTIPPSVNEIYGTNRYGRRFLTNKGKAYKEHFQRYLIDNYFNEINKLNINGIYSLEIGLHMRSEDLINDKFGKDKRIKSPYKKLDADNRIKLLQDCLSSAIGIDDSRFFEVRIEKLISTGTGIIIVLTEQCINRYEAVLPFKPQEGNT